MQALHVSGQAAEIRDPLPVRGPASGEVDNSEHPFMKLLTRIRNAMKQGNEPDLGNLDGVSKLGSDYLPKAVTMAGSASMAGIGLERPDGALQGGGLLKTEAGLGARNVSSMVLDEVDREVTSGLRESSHSKAKGRSLSSLLGSDEAPASDIGKATEAVVGSAPGKSSGAATDGAFFQGLAQTKQKSLPGLGGNELESASRRSTGNSTELLAKRSRFGVAESVDGATVAASGTLNGIVGAAGLKRNQNMDVSRDKGSLTSSVDEGKSTGRRPSRYSVVDMRLKASTEKTSMDRLADGKLEGKPAGAAGPEPNRSGLSGVDAAGRHISNDQPAGGFTEGYRGAGAESSDKAPASFADNLAARLRDGGSMDIVRSAQIVLKDGDAGLIRLRLEPESLGGVKIELKMADKQISARIIVESDLAGEAFRSSLDSLRDAFASSGFETTSIEVEVRDGRTGTGDAGRGDAGKDGDEEGRRLYAARKAEELGSAVPSADSVYGRYSVIDLVV